MAEQQQQHHVAVATPREYELSVRQQPKQARMCGVGADRRPIDPPPIVQLRVIERGTVTVPKPQQPQPTAPLSPSPSPPPGGAPSSSVAVEGPSAGQGVLRAAGDGTTAIDASMLTPSGFGAGYLQNPYYFMFASLAKPDEDTELHWMKDGKTRCTTGSVVSSLYHLKDAENDNRDAGFFVFPDLSVRQEGSYRLKLSLFEVVGSNVFHCKSIFSSPFYVYTAKKFPGMEESTPLSCSLAEQGIKIRIRKDIRQRKPRPGAPSFPAGFGAIPAPVPIPEADEEENDEHTETTNAHDRLARLSMEAHAQQLQRHRQELQKRDREEWDQHNAHPGPDDHARKRQRTLEGEDDVHMAPPPQQAPPPPARRAASEWGIDPALAPGGAGAASASAPPPPQPASAPPAAASAPHPAPGPYDRPPPPHGYYSHPPPPSSSEGPTPAPAPGPPPHAYYPPPPAAHYPPPPWGDSPHHPPHAHAHYYYPPPAAHYPPPPDYRGYPPASGYPPAAGQGYYAPPPGAYRDPGYPYGYPGYAQPPPPQQQQQPAAQQPSQSQAPTSTASPSSPRASAPPSGAPQQAFAPSSQYGYAPPPPAPTSAPQRPGSPGGGSAPVPPPPQYGYAPQGARYATPPPATSAPPPPPPQQQPPQQSSQSQGQPPQPAPAPYYAQSYYPPPPQWYYPHGPPRADGSAPAYQPPVQHREQYPPRDAYAPRGYEYPQGGQPGGRSPRGEERYGRPEERERRNSGGNGRMAVGSMLAEEEQR